MIKNMIQYMLFSGTSAGIGLFTVYYMTKNMTAEQFGIVGLFTALLYVLPQLISFSTISLVSINKVKMEHDSFLCFSKSYFTFSGLIFVFVLLSSYLVSFLFNEYRMLFLIIPIIGFIQYLLMFHYAELIQNKKVKTFGAYRVLLSLLSLLLTVVFISYFNFSWDGRLYSILISEALLLGISLKFSFFTLRKSELSFSKDKFKEYFHFGLPLFSGLGAGWILNQADKFIVFHYFSLKDVGVYSLAYSIGMIINMINQSAVNAIIPSIYKKLHDKKGHEIVKSINIYYSLMVLVLALLVGGSSFWYIPLFFNHDYIDSPFIILFIALAFSFSGMYRVSGAIIAFYKKNNLQMMLLYLSAIINFVCSIALIPVFGLFAPSISTLLAYILLAYLSYIYGWKILRKEEKC